MDMPILPAISGNSETGFTGEGGGEVESLPSLLAQITEPEMEELVAVANEAYLNGELDELMAAEEGGEAPVSGQPSVEGEVLAEEVEGEESRDSAPGEMEPVDPAEAPNTVSVFVSEIETAQAHLLSLSEAANESDVDTARIEEALTVVETVLGQVEEAVRMADKASADGDPDLAAKAVRLATDAAAAAQGAVADATRSAEEEVASAGAGEGDAPQAVETPLAMWLASQA